MRESLRRAASSQWDQLSPEQAFFGTGEIPRETKTRSSGCLKGLCKTGWLEVKPKHRQVVIAATPPLLWEHLGENMKETNADLESSSTHLGTDNHSFGTGTKAGLCFSTLPLPIR